MHPVELTHPTAEVGASTAGVAGRLTVVGKWALRYALTSAGHTEPIGDTGAKDSAGPAGDSSGGGWSKMDGPPRDNTGSERTVLAEPRPGLASPSWRWQGSLHGCKALSSLCEAGSFAQLQWHAASNTQVAELDPSH